MFEYDRARVDELRPQMIEEYLSDVASQNRFRSSRLSSAGWAQLAELVLEACQSRDELWLARSLEPFIVSHEQTSKGTRKVNATSAATMLADGILNSLICRAECIDSIENRSGKVVAYRAGSRREPRAESRFLIGQRFDAAQTLVDLRADASDPGGNRSPVPVGLNSGLSLKALD